MWTPPMTDKFVAIDFETANADLASICQIGVVTYAGGVVIDEWSSLVNPEDYFDGYNTAIHGIDERTVANAPTFPQVFESFRGRIDGEIVVNHTAFDRTAINQTYKKYKLSPIACTWLNSASVVRRTWSNFAQKGYALKNVCKTLGIEFNHHDALEDARAAGKVLVRAIEETGLSLDEWLARVHRPIDIRAGSVARVGNPDGPLAGEVMVFTGALSISRREAADLAAKVGCEVALTVKKTTTLLVVGDQDLGKLAGREKSSKHRKVEEMIAKGCPIRILKETDFLQLVELETDTN